MNCWGSPQRMTRVSGPTLTFTGSCATEMGTAEVKNLAVTPSRFATYMMVRDYVWWRLEYSQEIYVVILIKKPWQSQSATTVKQAPQQTLPRIDGKLPGKPIKWLRKRARHHNQKEHTLSATTLWAQAWVGWPSRMENMRCAFFWKRMKTPSMGAVCFAPAGWIWIGWQTEQLQPAWLKQCDQLQV